MSWELVFQDAFLFYVGGVRNLRLYVRIWQEYVRVRKKFVRLFQIYVRVSQNYVRLLIYQKLKLIYDRR